MSDFSIKVQNLGKKYTIRHDGIGAGIHSWTLRDTLTRSTRNLKRQMARLVGGNQPSSNEPARQNIFWALQDVSFEVKEGEIIGLIGRNGAGKSTLLKLLSRVTGPTTGRIEINGRVASLLEVGTGFNGELSGRENVYLNGAILGMTRAEINARFDEIVAFAEVETFIDTPVKRYSSGMFVRLAFAVAAHLQTEIMILDEVLAVGDSKFHERCLAKLKDVARNGNTVLLVSHQMNLIQSFASRCLMLENGKLIAQGEPGPIINRYLGQKSERYDLSRFVNQSDNGTQFLGLSFSSGERQWPDSVPQGDPLTAHIEVNLTEAIPQGNIYITLVNGNGVEIFSHYLSESLPTERLTVGRHQFDIALPTAFLRPDAYTLTLVIIGNHSEHVASLNTLEMPPIIPSLNHDKAFEARRPGLVNLPCQWIQKD